MRGEAGDAAGRPAAPPAGPDLDGFAAEGEDLSDAGDVGTVVEGAGDPDGAPLAAAVFRPCALVDEIRRPGAAFVGQEPDIVMRVRLLAPDGEQAAGAAVEEVSGQRPPGEPRIGDDGAACDVG